MGEKRDLANLWRVERDSHDGQFRVGRNFYSKDKAWNEFDTLRQMERKNVVILEAHWVDVTDFGRED